MTAEMPRRKSLAMEISIVRKQTPNAGKREENPWQLPNRHSPRCEIFIDRDRSAPAPSDCRRVRSSLARWWAWAMATPSPSLGQAIASEGSGCTASTRAGIMPSVSSRSKENLSALCFGKSVRVASRVTDTGRYGRTVGRVFVGEVNVNLEQVRAGMAWRFTRYDRAAEFTAERRPRASTRFVG